MSQKILNILGIRGYPAAHGGFETFAARLAPHLRDRGWTVNIYCQLEPDKSGFLQPDYEDEWEGINRIHLGSSKISSTGSVVFDWRCVRHVLDRPGVDLVLGYNTAIFTALQRVYGRKVFMNMDGIEWKRAKWSPAVKAWFYLNELLGYNLCSRPIADHPEIARHLKRHGFRNATIIPYGADRITEAPLSHIGEFGLEAGKYFISIARPEPENSILEMVQAYSSAVRGMKLVVLGSFKPDNPYHVRVQAAASSEVVFPGAIYDAEKVSALRFYARAYLHGHQVGGTNPSLVEALGAGNAVIAHDNRFNRWVAGDGQYYFSSVSDLENIISHATTDTDWGDAARLAAVSRYEADFTWDSVLGKYEQLLLTGIRTSAPATEPKVYTVGRSE